MSNKDISQDVINVMVVQNAEGIEKLNNVVFGNGSRGIDEIVRGIEKELSALSECVTKKYEEERQAELQELKDRKKFRRNALLSGAVALGSILVPIIVVLVRVYPFLSQMANTLATNPIP